MANATGFENGPRSMSWHEKHRSTLVLLSVVLIAVWGPFRFSWFSVCDRCGHFRSSESRQLPLLAVS